MRKLLAAIGRALAAMGRTVWTRCKETGRLIASIIPGIGGGGGAAPSYQDESEVTEAAQPPGLDHVRALAAAIASGSVQPEMLESVSEDVFEWLSVLDRKMITSVLMADDQALREHMRGQRGISGVVRADKESVKAYRAAIERDDQHDAEMEMIPIGMAMA